MSAREIVEAFFRDSEPPRGLEDAIQGAIEEAEEAAEKRTWEEAEDEVDALGRKFAARRK